MVRGLLDPDCAEAKATEQELESRARSADVRFGSKADIAVYSCDVRLPLKADINRYRRAVRLVPIGDTNLAWNLREPARRLSESSAGDAIDGKFSVQT